MRTNGPCAIRFLDSKTPISTCSFLNFARIPRPPMHSSTSKNVPYVALGCTTGCCDNENTLLLGLFLPGSESIGNESAPVGRSKLQLPKYLPPKGKEALRALDQHPYRAVATRRRILPNDTGLCRKSVQVTSTDWQRRPQRLPITRRNGNQNTSDIHQPQLVINPFLTFQHMTLEAIV